MLKIAFYEYTMGIFLLTPENWIFTTYSCTEAI